MNFKGVEICCPYCKGDLREVTGEEKSLVCKLCDRGFPVVFGIPDLRIFPDPYIDKDADRQKGSQIASRFDQTDFEALVDFYYSITPVVPPADAKRYAAGLRAGLARAKASLVAWEKCAAGNAPAETLLEVGCGTAPVMVAAAHSFKLVVGVDIAFRWLVVAKKRIAEADLDVPLICACAEALPFPDGAFDRVVADSVVEHVRDQPAALREAFRVSRPGGNLFVSTPNRYSLGPDPHVGVWAGGFLPKRWLSAYVRRQGGIPPKRRLLSARSVARLIREAGFSAPSILLPEIPAGQRSHFGSGMRTLIDLYQIARQLPVSRHLLGWVGPLLYALAHKPDKESPTDSRVGLNKHISAHMIAR